MVALSQDRNTPVREGARRFLPVAEGAKLFAGALVILSGGFAEPGSAKTGARGVGRAEEFVDNTDGADGDRKIAVRAGVLRYANSGGGDAIAIADIGATAYVVDDQTVAKTHATNTRSPAGTVYDVDDQGVWIRFD